MADGRDLGFGPTRSRNIRSADPKTLPQNQTRNESHDPLQKYGHSTFSKMSAGHHFGFSLTVNSAIRSADLENPNLEPNIKWNRWTHCWDMATRNFPRWRCHHLGFGPIGNSAIRSADLVNPTLEPNIKWIGWPLAEIWPFKIFQNARLVGCRSVLNIYIDVMYSSSLHYECSARGNYMQINKHNSRHFTSLLSLLLIINATRVIKNPMSVLSNHNYTG